MNEGHFISKFREILNLSPVVKKLFKHIIPYIIIFELIKLVPPYVFKEIIDVMVTDATRVSGSLILILLAGYLASLLAMGFIDHLAFKKTHYGIASAETDVTMRAFDKLLTLDITYHERENTGGSMSKVIRGKAKLNRLLWDITYQLIPVTFQAVFTLIVMFWIGFEIGIAFLFFLPMFLIISRRGVAETQAYREEYHEQEERFGNLATQAIMNIKTVKDFYAEGKEKEKARVVLQKYFRAVQKRIALGARNLVTQDVILTVARVVTLGLAVWLMLQGRITAGSLVFVMTLSEKAYLNLSRLYRLHYHIQDAEPSIERFEQISNAKVRVKDVRSAHKVTRGKVTLQTVTYTYDGTNIAALTDVSLTIKPRQTLALVGKSGVGKSTLVKLLFRHADPQKGSIAVDDRDLREYSLKNLRNSMAVVSQDVELFNETVLENIAYGVVKTTKEAVVKAAKMANAHEFIMQLPNKYATLVGERGVKLSGGQKQRIAIARALLRKPKILIFDEATSSLDAESEKEIHEAIFSLVGRLTLIIIAHRFSTIEHADTIVLLEDGRVAEVGTRQELIRKKGIFAKLRKLQELGDVE